MGSKLTKDSGVILGSDPNILGGDGMTGHGKSVSRHYLWAGYVVHVDTETMACSVRLETGYGDRQDVPIPASGGAGPRSFAGCLPEKGSKVLIGWKRYGNRDNVPYIVATLPPGTYLAKDYSPFSSADPEEVQDALTLDPGLKNDPHLNLDVVRLKARKGYSGDFVASSSSGADFILDRDVYFTNRGGSEMRLRDSDQTLVVQTVNEFTASSAGYRRLGLIKRNALNLLPDLYLSGETEDGVVRGQDVEDFFAQKAAESPDGNVYVDNVLTDSPAFKKLKEFGLVDDSGNVVFDNQENALLYPYIVSPDGQRSSYVVDFERDSTLVEAAEAYVEDRQELFHTHNGIMAVTDEGDGVQIDHPLERVFIEDVKGTVVGNDAYTGPGRQLYKQILTMSIFGDADDWVNPEETPSFSPVDTLMSGNEAKTKALARLFRIKCPADDSSQYTFGITKEGRVYLHVPRSKTGLPGEVGRSLDASIAGTIKAIVGADPERISVDFKSTGGIRLDVGAFQDTNGDSVSVDVTYQGKVNTTYAGTAAAQTTYNGSKFDSIGGQRTTFVRGSDVTVCSSTKSIRAENMRLDIGTGGIATRSAGDVDQTTLGRTTRQYALLRQTTMALGQTTVSLAGVDSYTMLVGSKSTFVAAGNYSVGTGTGNYSIAVGAGNLSATIGAGNLALATGAGSASLVTAAGSASVASSVNTNVVAGAVANVTAPVVKVGAAIVGSAVAGVPGPPAPHFDYITGLPLRGVPTVLIG